MRARAHPLAAELVKAGHEVTMFLPPYDNPQDCGREWEQEGVRIKNMGARISGKIRTGRLQKEKYPGLLFELITEVRRYRSDVIHVFKPKGFAGAAGTYFLLKGAPVVLDCDDWEGWDGWNEVKRYPWVVKEYIDRQERGMIRRARAVTVASRVLEKRAIRLRKSDAGVYYLPNCGPSEDGRELQASVRALSCAEVRRGFGFPDGPLVLYCGHPGEENHVLALCRGVAHVAREIPLALVLLGVEAKQSRAERQLRIDANVSLHQLPRLAYRDFLRAVWASDVAVFPYTDDDVHRAKCSARIVDYMAMNKAVLTSGVGENLEYIVNGESGILVEPGNEHQFATELKRLLSDAELRKHLGTNAATRIAQHYRWDRVGLRQCLKAYEHVLGADLAESPAAAA